MESVLFSRDEWKLPSRTRCMTYVETYSVSRQSFTQSLDGWEIALKLARRARCCPRHTRHAYTPHADHHICRPPYMQARCLMSIVCVRMHRLLLGPEASLAPPRVGGSSEAHVRGVEVQGGARGTSGARLSNDEPADGGRRWRWGPGPAGWGPGPAGPFEPAAVKPSVAGPGI